MKKHLCDFCGKEVWQYDGIRDGVYTDREISLPQYGSATIRIRLIGCRDGGFVGDLCGDCLRAYLFGESRKFDDETVHKIVLSCCKPRHKWTDGWICEHCGKRKADLEEFKYDNPKHKILK